MKICDLTEAFNIKLYDRSSGQFDPEYHDLVYGTKKNRDVFDRLAYFNGQDASNEVNFVVTDKDKIVAVGGLEPSPYKEDKGKILWVKHVSVDPAYKGRGIARSIIEAMYKYALERHMKLRPSSFTQQGQILKPIFQRLNQQYPAAADDRPFKDF